MAFSFSNFFETTDWRDDLMEADANWDYYHSFNEQVYGFQFTYDDVTTALPEYAQMAGNMVIESKKKKQTEEPNVDAVDDGDEDEEMLMNFTRKQWQDHQDGIKKMFRPRRDKSGRLRNPHAGIKLVSPGDNNPKTEKGFPGTVVNPHHGKKRPIKNAVMHLLPAGFSGCNTCSAHTPECAASCLDVAGNPGFMGVKTSGRARRTFMFAYNKNAAMLKLAREVERMSQEAHGADLNFGLRLNGTSDIPWESERYWFTYNRKSDPGKKHALSRDHADCDPSPDAKKSIFCHFPEVQFYDYTKIFSRAMAHAEGRMPPNYHLTFSYSEKTNLADMEKLLDAGGNVAMVFAFSEKNFDPEKAEKTARKRATERGKEYKPSTLDRSDRELVSDAGPYKLPKVWRGENGKIYKIVSGDVHDLRFVDGKGVIVGLAAKGDAKFVQSNGRKQVFVVQPDDPHLRYEHENKAWVVSATKAHPSRLKTVESRKKQDDKFVADLRARAAKLPDGDEKDELLDRAERIASGKVNYFGKDAQRNRSNAMYALAKEPDAPDADNPDGLSPLEFTRKVFQQKAARDMETRINREIKAKEREEGREWPEDAKEAYRAKKRKEYKGDYDGLTPFNQQDGLPHHQATDRGKAPNELLSLGLGAVGPLARHIARHKDDFEQQYAAALAPKGRASIPSSTPLTPADSAKPSRQKVRAESTNPYMAPWLDLISE